MKQNDAILAKEFELALCKHFGLPVNMVQRGMQMHTGADEFLGVTLRISLSNDDMTAIAAHMSDPSIKNVDQSSIDDDIKVQINRLNVKADETLVLMTNKTLSEERQEQMDANLKKLLPDGVKVLVLSGDMTLSKVSSVFGS